MKFGTARHDDDKSCAFAFIVVFDLILRGCISLMKRHILLVRQQHHHGVSLTSYSSRNDQSATETRQRKEDALSRLALKNIIFLS